MERGGGKVAAAARAAAAFADVVANGGQAAGEYLSLESAGLEEEVAVGAVDLVPGQGVVEGDMLVMRFGDGRGNVKVKLDRGEDLGLGLLCAQRGFDVRQILIGATLEIEEGGYELAFAE